MNRQPYGTPPRWWEPKLEPAWVKLTRAFRWRKLRRGQQLVGIDVAGLHHVRDAVAAGKGVLIVPNHSAHYDSEALYVAADRISQPLYMMTAWQVFAMSTRFECWFMQRMGCFSINRESTDRQAFRQALNVLTDEPQPLVIFPEGDIYHVSDRVTPFREGAAAIVQTAARRGKRPVVVIPCGIKFRYVDDPTPQLEELVERLERRVLLRPHPEYTLVERVYRLAEGVLALQELDFLGQTRSGVLKERIAFLTESILSDLQHKYDVRAADEPVPERVKLLRQAIIQRCEGPARCEVPTQRNGRVSPAANPAAPDMDALFFVMQLYSYPSNYLRANPTIERLAETLDKLEEDILGQALPTVRGSRRVAIRFGEPIEVAATDRRRAGATELTRTLEIRVQALLDQLNELKRE